MYVMTLSSILLLVGLFTWPGDISANGDIGGQAESEKPRNVVAEVINGTGVSLRWEPPKVTSASCPVKGYIVRLKTDLDKRPKRWTVDADRYSLKLFSLLESTTYHVRILAVLCNGKMTHSQWVTVQTRRRPASDVTTSSSSSSSSSGHTSSGNSILEDRPPGKPQSVKTRTFSDSVFVSWLSPDEDIVVRGYMVGYGEGVPDVNWQYVDSRARNLTINNLKSSTQYVISLRAFNNVDKGPVVYDLVHTREKIAVPSVNPAASTPSNLKARILSSTTVWLQWTDLSLGAEQTITDNRYYNVHYQALPNGKTLSVIVKALHVVLYDLTPGTEYSFKVRAINDAKSSPFSLMVLNKTLEAAPGTAPLHVEAVVGNGSVPSVTIKWKPPTEANGEVSGYLLQYTDSVARNTTDWTVVGVEGWMTDTTLPDLKPNTVYQLKMQARNSMGYGPLSPIITFRTAALPVSHKSPSLGESVHDDGDLQDLLEDMGAKGKDDQPAASTLIKVKEDRQSIGVVRSAARVIDNSDGDASPRAAAMTGPAPLDLDLNTVVRHTVNAVLTFKPVVPSCNAPSAPEGDKPPSPGSARTTYRVRMLDFAQAQEVRVIPVEAGTVLLEGLRPWRVYRYQVEAINDSGHVIGVSKEDTIDTKP